MNFLEFLTFAIYLSFLASIILALQIYNPGKQIREAIHIEESDEKFDEKVFEEPDSDEEEVPFDPSKEDYTMTENPMLRHRNVLSEMEMVD